MSLAKAHPYSPVCGCKSCRDERHRLALEDWAAQARGFQRWLAQADERTLNMLGSNAPGKRDVSTGPRYRVGCAGMFVLGTESSYRDEDEAIVACQHGPPGCEVFDMQTGEWIGPTCMEEIRDARRRLAARRANAR